MLSLAQAASLPDDSGQKLPVVWREFDELKIHRRRGQLYLTAAAPGGFKSVFALNEAIKMQVPCLYLSMDTDPHTMSVRAVQLLTHMLQDSAEAAVNEHSPIALDALAQVTWVKFAFPSSPDVDEIVHRVFAYAEMHGEFPHWIVVDNLMDVAFEEDENRGINRIMEDMAKLARLSKAGVHVLHHTTGEYEDGHTVIPQSGLRNKVAKKPSMALTMCRGKDGELLVSVVKNRYGPADPSGYRTRAKLRVAPEIMQVV